MSLSDKPVIDIAKYDFHWQRLYQLQTPMRFSNDDTVGIKCNCDNTQARRDQQGFTEPMSTVTWGEGTQEEMCLAYV